MSQNGGSSDSSTSYLRNRIGHRHHRKRGNKRRLSDCKEEEEHEHNCGVRQRKEIDPHHQSPPIPWSDDFHREFAKAVFQIGIDQSSPAIIAEEMIVKNNYNTHANANAASSLEPSSLSERKTEEESKQTARSTGAGALLTNRSSSSSQTNQASNRQEKLLTEYYKRELTGERLKSHLQKLRKQKDREIEMFVEDYDAQLAREKSIDRDKKELAEREKKRRDEARERRRRLRKKRQRPPNLLEPDDWGTDASESGSGRCEQVDATEEEERLLSLYLPLRAVGSDINRHDDDEHDQDSKSSFPAGGKAIGGLAWVVQKDMEARANCECHRQRDQRPRNQPKSRQNATGAFGSEEHSGVDDGSVLSATSHAAIAAGEVADALAAPHHRRRKPNHRRKKIIDCASSEDEDIDTDDEEKDVNEEDHRDTVSIPTLTEAEQNSPLGVSMRLTWDLVRYMHGVIAEERAKQHQEQKPLERKEYNDDDNNNSNMVDCKDCKTERALPANMHTGENALSRLPVDTDTSAKVYQEINHQNNGHNENHGCNHMGGNPYLAAAMAANGPPPAAFMASLTGSAMTVMGGTEGFGGLPMGTAGGSFFPAPSSAHFPSQQHIHESENQHGNFVVTPQAFDPPSSVNRQQRF